MRSALCGAAVAALVLACAAQAGAQQLNLNGPLPGFPAGAPRAPEGFPGILFNVPYSPEPLPENGYRGVYGHTTCVVDEIIRPDSTQQLADAIKDVAARAAKAGRPLKMRTTHDAFATMHSMPCPVQPADPDAAKKSAAELTVGILMDKMTKVLSFDKDKYVVKVQAQMDIKGLLTFGNEHGVSPPRSALPWWQGLTLGGIFSTASHGTGRNVTSSLCDWFIDVTWVDSAGNVHVSEKGSDEATALCGGIGLLGSITEFTLQLTPYSNTWLSTWYLHDDKDIADDIDKMLAISPHLVVMWRPDIGKYTGHLQRPAPPGAKVVTAATSNVIPQFTPLTARVLGPGLRNWQNDPFNRDPLYFVGGFDAVSCTSALTSAVGAAWATVPGPLTSTVGVSTPLLEGVAPTNNIISTDCGDRCAFTQKDMQANALDVEFCFEKANLREVIADIKSLIAKDLKGLPGWGARTRCLMPGYYVFRFGKSTGDEAMIAMSANKKDPVYVQQQMLASKNTPGVPSKYEWVQDTYEQLMLCKHGGFPHPGKNWDRTFTNPKCPIAPKLGEGLQRFQAVQDKYDPKRVFEPELWTRAVKGEKFFAAPRCQLNRSCYCERDEHCADGFQCVPSVAFPEFKACRPKAMNH